MTALDISTFEASVEALIQQQLAAYETALRESLAQQAGGAGKGGARNTRRRSKSRPTRATASSGSRRTAEEIDALAERFFGAVEAAPGETMTVLAAGLGVRAQELERPVSRLKKSGRIRTVGERSRTRYYPMTPPSA